MLQIALPRRVLADRARHRHCVTLDQFTIEAPHRLRYLGDAQRGYASLTIQIYPAKGLPQAELTMM